MYAYERSVLNMHIYLVTVPYRFFHRLFMTNWYLAAHCCWDMQHFYDMGRLCPVARQAAVAVVVDHIK